MLPRAERAEWAALETASEPFLALTSDGSKEGACMGLALQQSIWQVLCLESTDWFLDSGHVRPQLGFIFCPDSHSCCQEIPDFLYTYSCPSTSDAARALNESCHCNLLHKAFSWLSREVNSWMIGIFQTASLKGCMK